MIRQFSEKELKLVQLRFTQMSGAKNVLQKQQFKESLGILGQDHATFLLDRLFNLITDETTINYKQYVEYLRILMYGDQVDQAKMSFKFMDLEKKGYIVYRDFEKMLLDLTIFWNAITGSRITPSQQYIQNMWDQFEATQQLDFNNFLNKYEVILGNFDWYDFFNQPQIEYVNTQYLEEVSKAQQIQRMSDQFQSLIGNCVNLLSDYEKEQKCFIDSSGYGPCNFSTSQIAKDGDNDPSFEVSFLSKIQAQRIQSFHSSQLDGPLEQMLQHIQYLQTIVDSTINFQYSMHHNNMLLSSQSNCIRKRATLKKFIKSKPKQQISVYFGHENWNLILNLMIGMRKCIMFIQPEFYGSTVLRNEFKTNHVHDVIEFKSSNLDFKKSYQIKEYAASIFLRIRRLYSVTNGEYIRSVGPENLIGSLMLGKLNSLTELGSTGKRLYCLLVNKGNYMIKTISKDEGKLLKRILPSYFNHLNNNRNTLISRIFGFNQLKIRKGKGEFNKIYLITIVNVFRSGLDIEFRYDIKGSLYGRQSEKSESEVVLKDVDMLQRKDYLILEQQDRKELMECIEQDMKFMAEMEIIDYSLLIGYHLRSQDKLAQYGQFKNSALFYESFEGGLLSEDRKWIYYIGIIDILTNYGTKKQIEYGLKSTLISSDISCIPPQRYGRRFVDFISSNVLEPTYLQQFH